MKRFERYRIVPGLDKQSGEYQVNAFMYAVGDDAEDQNDTDWMLKDALKGN